jgi:hypothetical protein
MPRMLLPLLTFPFLVVGFSLSLAAQDHRVEILEESVPADAVSEELLAKMEPTGVRVIRGESRTICDVWWCKEWPVDSAEATGDVIYPFTTGQLLGVVRFPRRSSDFRDQQVDRGVYTLRYGKQPVDGAHVGTSPTRDFALLVPASDDKSLTAPDYDELVELSNKASGTTHPALLSLQRTEGDEAIRHISLRDWWLVRLEGKVRVGDETQPMPVDMVVVGKAE